MKQELDSLTQPIINIYNQLEADLLIEIASRFDTYDSIGGSLEWQIKKLDELGALNDSTVKLISRLSIRSEQEIIQMLNDAGYANFDLETLNKAFDMGKLTVDPYVMMDSPVMSSILKDSFKQLQGTYRLINTKAIESAKQCYMDVINRCYIEVSSGTLDYQTSIRRGLQKMAAKGITGATYSRGGTIVQYSLEGTVRRDTLTAVNQLANKVAVKGCEELGAEYVEISSHIGARVNLKNPIANHAGWQGKVYKINGSEPKYPNLKASTGYPDDILGLAGVNCRHRIFPFIPGVSIPNPIQYDEIENTRVYKLTQEQRAMERNIRKTKKQMAVANASCDDKQVAKLKKRLDAQNDKIADFCNRNGLKRDYSRENITY